MPSAETTKHQLEQAILNDLDHAAPYAVYADWLLDRGDPRGELIKAQLALESARPALSGDVLEGLVEWQPTPEQSEGMAQAQRLLEEHADEWLAGAARDPAIQVSWRRGFVDAVELDHDRLAGRRAGEVLHTLLQSPAGCWPRRLTSRGQIPFEGEWNHEYESTVHTLRRLRPPLRELTAHFSTSCDWQEADAMQLDLGALWDALAHLRSVTVRSQEVTLGLLHAPQLEVLRVAAESLLDFAALSTATLPALHTLELEVRNNPPAPTDFERVLDGPTFASLRHLVLRDVPSSLLRRVAHLELVKQLESLEVHHVGVHGEASLTLDPKHPAFQHLRSFRCT